MSFKTGHPGGPGRPKGSPNKLTRTVRQAFEEAFEVLQADQSQPYALAPWGMKNPDKFYLLAAKLIPVQVQAQVDDVTQLDPTVRAARLAAFTARLASRRDGGDEELEGSDLA